MPLLYRWKGTPETQKETQQNRYSGHVGIETHIGNSSEVIEQIVGYACLELRREVRKYESHHCVDAKLNS